MSERAPSHGWRRHARGGRSVVLAAAMVAVLAPMVLYLPLVQQVGVIVSVVLGFALISRPTVALLAIFGVRIAIDVLWWTPPALLGMNVMELFAGSVSALALAMCLTEQERVQRHAFFLPVLPFLLVMAIAAVRVGDVRVAAELMARFGSPVLLMFLVSTLFGEQQHRAMLRVIPLAALVPMAIGYHALATDEWVMLEGLERLRGAYFDTHNHAHAMALFMAVGVLHLRLRGFSRHGLLAAAFTAASGVLLYFTYVRTAFVGFAVFALLFLIGERMWRHAFAAVAAAAAALATSTVLQTRFADVLLAFSDSAMVQHDELGSGRLGIWTTSFERYLERPVFDRLFGLGLDGHKVLTPHQLDPHCDYLSLLFQMGPLALGVYLVFQAMLAARAWRLTRADDPFVRRFASFMLGLNGMVFVTNVLSNSYVSRIHVAWLFWGLAGVLFAMDARQRPPR